MRGHPEPGQSGRSAATWFLVGSLALLTIACTTDDDTDDIAEITQRSAESDERAMVSTAENTATTTTVNRTTASVTPKPPTTAGSDTLLVEPDSSAVEAAEAVLVAVDGRNNNVGDAYDIGGDRGCPLLASFDGRWVAEAGGSVFCLDEAETFAVGAARQGYLAELIREEAFEPFDDGADASGPIGRWCNAESCIAS